MYEITVRNPSGEVESKIEWDENNRSVLIGRDPGCDLILNTPQASRKHCRIELEDGELNLVDLESMNGTFYEGISIDRIQLNDHDLFKVEDWVIEIKPEGEFDDAEMEKDETTTSHPAVSPEDDSPEQKESSNGPDPKSSQEQEEDRQKQAVSNQKNKSFGTSSPPESVPAEKNSPDKQKSKPERTSKKRSPLRTFLMGLLYSAILTVIGAAVGSTVTVYLLNNPEIELLGFSLDYKIEKKQPENPSLSNLLPSKRIEDTVIHYYKKKAEAEQPVTEGGYFLRKHRKSIFDTIFVQKNYRVGQRHVALVNFTADGETYHDAVWLCEKDGHPLVSRSPLNSASLSDDRNRLRYFFGADEPTDSTDRRRVDEIIRRARSWLDSAKTPPWK